MLFDSGQTTLKLEGQKAISQLSAVLKTIPSRRFQVAGDTDDVPIGRSSFQSNWELSAARAVEVVRFFVKEGVKPRLLSAAGYREFDPVVPNDTPANRAKNRRIEISSSQTRGARRRTGDEVVRAPLSARGRKTDGAPSRHGSRHIWAVTGGAGGKPPTASVSRRRG